MYADQIRRAAEAAPRVELPKVAERLWRAYGAGLVTEAEATGLSELIEALKAVPASPPPARKHVGSRPRTDASTARRRRWAASGWLPPTLATRFTAAELAALAVVAAEVAQRGDCRMPIERIAAVGGGEQDHGQERHPAGATAGVPDSRGTATDGVPKRHERDPHHRAGVDLLAAARPPGEAPGGWGQICDHHEHQIPERRQRRAGERPSRRPMATSRAMAASIALTSEARSSGATDAICDSRIRILVTTDSRIRRFMPPLRR